MVNFILADHGEGLEGYGIIAFDVGQCYWQQALSILSEDEESITRAEESNGAIFLVIRKQMGIGTEVVAKVAIIGRHILKNAFRNKQRTLLVVIRLPPRHDHHAENRQGCLCHRR